MKRNCNNTKPIQQPLGFKKSTSHAIEESFRALNSSYAFSDISFIEPKRRASEHKNTKIQLILEESYRPRNRTIIKADTKKIYKEIFKGKNYLLKSDLCKNNIVPNENTSKSNTLINYFYPYLSSTQVDNSNMTFNQFQASLDQNIQQCTSYIPKTLLPQIVIPEEEPSSGNDARTQGTNSPQGNCSNNSSFFYSQSNTNNSFFQNKSHTYGYPIQSPQGYQSPNEQEDNYPKQSHSFTAAQSQKHGNSSFYYCQSQSNTNAYRENQEIKIENYSNTVLGGLSLYLVKEQNGCRFLQERVRKDHDFANNHLLPNLLKEIDDIICDPFVLTGIKQNFLLICLSPYGTRVVQNIIEVIKNKQELLNEFNQLITSKIVTEIANDIQGNYILQKYIIDIPAPGNQFIYDIINDKFMVIAQSKHGCCTIQKCLKEASSMQKEQLMVLISKNMYALMTNQYGNYIFQYIITKETAENQMKIIKIVLVMFVSFCKQRFSSNAIEKCFENSNEMIQSFLLKELSEKDYWVQELIVDSYGNYIIQKALNVSKGEIYTKLLTAIAKSVKYLKRVPFGNKLIGKLLSKHNELGYILTNEQQNENNNNKAVLGNETNNDETNNKVPASVIWGMPKKKNGLY